MKKAFTLVELLIVVVVLVTLMSITFRLSSIGGDQSRRSATISRLQRLENCLSGYYAAFGSYPQVRLHGSRNIQLKVNDHGIQLDDEEPISWGWTALGAKDEQKAWRQVKAACRSQPVGCNYPFPAEPAYNNLVKAVSDAMKKKVPEAVKDGRISEEQSRVFLAGFDNGVTDNIGRHNRNRNETDWRQIQLFKFGLLSFLLPRYIIMMDSKAELYQNGNFKQWDSNNQLPVNPLKGMSAKWDWSMIRNYAINPDDAQNFAQVANIPSQAVCARWMPNLAEMVCCNHDYSIYGINIRGDVGALGLSSDNFNMEVYTPGGSEGDSTSQQYVLDGATVLDGWWNEIYYYSPAPYQTYTLWSGGPNGRTFPPWISRKKLSADANRCVELWIEDDIVRMSN